MLWEHEPQARVLKGNRITNNSLLVLIVILLLSLLLLLILLLLFLVLFNIKCPAFCIFVDISIQWHCSVAGVEEDPYRCEEPLV